MSEVRGGIGRSASVVSLATMVSRVLGLVREQVLAGLFGAGVATDAFNVAFRIPNLLRDLFAEGAMSAAFVPTFTETLTKRGDADAWRLANLVANALLLITGLVVLAGILGSDAIVRLYAPGFAAVPGKIELTIRLTRIMMPFLLLVTLAAWAMGCLNARGRFFVPALAPAMFNLSEIGMGSLIVLWPALFAPQPIVWMAIAAVLGGLWQLQIQIPLLRREGFRFRFVPRLGEIFGDPGVRRILALMLPATIGLAATQINIFVNTYFATAIPSAVSWLNYAFRLMQLPIGLFGVAIAAATLPAVARHKAEGDFGRFGATLGQSLRLVFAVNVPAAIGLAVLGVPIVRVIFEHGRFHAGDTAATAAALRYYAIGLFAYSGVKVLVPAFYALGRTRVPVAISIGTVAANILLNILLIGPLGYRGLALATSVANVLSLALLVAFMKRAVDSLELRALFLSLGKILLAGTAMGAAALGVQTWLEGRFGIEGLLTQILVLTASILAALAVLLAAAWLLRIAEVRLALRSVLARLRP
jgi:putative peptidoglycan lipid II flippase